jgi:Lar family restriction alleviation protein
MKEIKNIAIKSCPWCGSKDIKFSSKTMGDSYERKTKYNRRHVSMYCDNCKTYGPRSIVEGTSYNGCNNEGLDTAIKAWNRRFIDNWEKL